MPVGAHPTTSRKLSPRSTLGEHLAALAALAALKSPPAATTGPMNEPHYASQPEPDTDQHTDPDTSSETSQPSLQNPTVARCREVYCDTLAEGRETGVSFRERKSNADHAYRCAMPALHGRQNIADFVACVAQGMLFDVFQDRDGTRLLYAAQVAYRASHEPLSAPNPPLSNRRIHRKKSNIAS